MERGEVDGPSVGERLLRTYVNEVANRGHRDQGQTEDELQGAGQEEGGPETEQGGQGAHHRQADRLERQRAEPLVGADDLTGDDLVLASQRNPGAGGEGLNFVTALCSPDRVSPTPGAPGPCILPAHDPPRPASQEHRDAPRP